MGHLSLKRLTAEVLEGGLLYWASWVMKGRLRGWESLFMGAQLGDLEWALLPESLMDERCSGSGAFLSMGALSRELGGRVPWRIGRKGSGDGHLFP
jgi:hypothetical protein